MTEQLPRWPTYVLLFSGPTTVVVCFHRQSHGITLAPRLLYLQCVWVLNTDSGTVNCNFNDSDICGYIDKSVGDIGWTRYNSIGKFANYHHHRHHHHHHTAFAPITNWRKNIGVEQYKVAIKLRNAKTEKTYVIWIKHKIIVSTECQMLTLKDKFLTVFFKITCIRHSA